MAQTLQQKMLILKTPVWYVDYNDITSKGRASIKAFIEWFSLVLCAVIFCDTMQMSVHMELLLEESG